MADEYRISQKAERIEGQTDNLLPYHRYGRYFWRRRTYSSYRAGIGSTLSNLLRLSKEEGRVMLVVGLSRLLLQVQ